MGAMLKSLGLLGTDRVEECSASDLVAQFVGQTGPKTRAMFDKALGGVLFIDEAYRWAGSGPLVAARVHGIRPCMVRLCPTQLHRKTKSSKGKP